MGGQWLLSGIGMGLAVGCMAVQSLAGLERPVNLRCEYRANPLGLSTREPRLSWQVNDDRRGAVQSACQIVVSTDDRFADPSAVVWDTGKVASDASVQVRYAGKPLAPATRYYWRVRTWDAADQASEWSQPSWWETALDGDFEFGWIAADDPARKDPLTWGDWIWNEKASGDKQTAFFRLPIILPDDKMEMAVARITVDNTYEFFVNGKEIGRHNQWHEAKQYELTEHLKPGKNMLAVRAYNQDGLAGLNFTMRIQFADGERLEFRTNDPWRTSHAEQPNWNGVDFEDASWAKPVTVKKLGEDPWKEIKGRTGPRRAMMLRKEISLKSKPVKARAYASGLGIYELRINGNPAGPDVFPPGWTHYGKRIQYQTYDVTGLLKEGPNALAALLGNGWWSGALGWASPATNTDEPLRFICQLDIEYADGSADRFGTDDTWKAFPAPILANTYYHGETYDARLEQPGWDAPGFDAGEWWGTVTTGDKLETLVPQESEPILVTQELPATQVTEPEKGVFIFDFGQNAAGRCRLKVSGPAGTTVKLRFCEVLTPDGKLYRDNYRGAQVTDYYTLKGEGEEVWEPRFTYRGFRYCELTGWPGAPEQKPPIDALVYRVLHSAPPMAGSFECSNWLINRIDQNVVWGQRSNLHSVPTDCPQRDERLGWMGDALAFAWTSCFNMHMAPFWSKWMHDVTDSQGEEGHTTDVAPVQARHGPAAPGWGDAVIVVPWTTWKFYGDTRIIEDSYEAMRKWVEFMRRKAPEHLYEVEGYGDWVAAVPSPKKPIGAAYYYYSTKLLSEMAAAIHRSDDARQYADLADKIAAAFNKKYLAADGNYPGGTQTANILPLYFGITPADRRHDVFGNLVDDIKQRGDHLSTGFLGTTYLMPLLSEFGRSELAWKLAVQTTYPSWGYMVVHGGTTIWELWDSDKQGPNMNSRNHFAFGTVGRWFYESLAGINLDPQRPGFKHVIIHPQPAGDLLFAKAEYRSLYGPIRSGWQRCDGKLTLEVSIPANTTATVHVPTLGNRQVTISEGGRVLVKDGQPVAGQGAAAGNDQGRVPGIRFSRMAERAVIFEVGAGEYRFEAQ